MELLKHNIRCQNHEKQCQNHEKHFYREAPMGLKQLKTQA